MNNYPVLVLQRFLYLSHTVAHSFHLSLITKTFTNSIGNTAVAWTGNCLHLLSMQCVIFTITYRWLRVRKTKLEQWSELQPIVADTAIHPGQCPQHPVQSLFDDHRDGVKERVSAAQSQQHHETVCNPVRPCFPMVLSLTTNHVPEAHCAERHKAEVQGLRVSPALHG